MKPYSKVEVDGARVIEEYLLTKGEQVVSADMLIQFSPLIDFGLIVYGLTVNSTNRMAMKFDLEKFFMRRGMGKMAGNETKYVRVSRELFEKVKAVNDLYR